MRGKTRAFSTERILVFSDPHLVSPVDGVPAKFCHDPRAISVVFQIMRNFVPDRIICAGDLLDMPLASPHAAKRGEEGQVWGKDGKLRSGLLEKDIELGKVTWEYIAEAHPKAKKHQLEGNHDRWVYQQLLKAPHSQYGNVGIRGIPWSDYGVEFESYDSREPRVDLGRVCVMHGHGSANGATMVSQHDNVVFGHSHQISYCAHDKNHVEKRRAWGIGCLCDTWAEYNSMGGAQNGWVHGFAVIFRRDDEFKVEVHEIRNHRILDFHGKEYQAKPLGSISRKLRLLELP